MSPTATKVKVPQPIVTAEFTFEKDTKNAVQYKQDESADGSRPEIGSIYLTKASLAHISDTTRIRVTVESIG